MRAGGQPAPWEQRLLRLLSEQATMPIDQLARFLDAEEGQALRLARHLVDRRYAVCRPLLHGEPPWVWLTHRGNRLSGTGFAQADPHVGALARIRATNEVRLHLDARAPEARWISARALRCEQGLRGTRLQAVVEFEGERHAIIVRPGHRHLEVLERARLEPLLARFEAVVVFGAPEVRRVLRGLAIRHGWRSLAVRPIPAPDASGTVRGRS